MKGNYGLDGPDYIIAFMILGISSLLIGFLSAIDVILIRNQFLFIWVGIVSLSVFFGLVYSSKVGKVLLARHLIRNLHLKGDEKILDVGCGRGLYLIEICQFLRKGRAYGLDIWKKRDQNGNRRETTLKNAERAHVSDLVEIVDGDMRAMPFDSNGFDVVVSSFAVHNVPQRQGKVSAVREMARVTKPGGTMTVVDFKSVPLYAQVLKELGWKEVYISQLNFFTFPPNRVLHAKKPVE